MLHEPERHEPLRPIAWDEARARAAIARIAADTAQRFDPERYWPLHPLDLEPGEDPRQVATTLYYGAAGVIWALRRLRALGAAPAGTDLVVDWDTLLARNRDWLRGAGSDADASWLMGATPMLMMMAGDRADPEPFYERLAALIAAHVDHPARELMWGAPGTLLAALFLHQRTGQARWAELFRATAARLAQHLQDTPGLGCRTWVQHLYGHRRCLLGAVHGFAGNASVLIRGRQLLDAADWRAWQRLIVDTVLGTAVREDDGANWRPDLPADDAAPWKRLMQVCHGAPGIVACVAGLPPEPALDATLLAAGQAIWRAGPLVKGSNLCHGTGGNGYAFLKLYRRSGDALWLERARAFAMHGIAQTEAHAAHYGRLRYSLWTGDPGFALYLWDCVQAQARFPTLDVFDA